MKEIRSGVYAARIDVDVDVVQNRRLRAAPNTADAALQHVPIHQVSH